MDDRMELDHVALADYYNALAADELKQAPWIQQSGATYEDLYGNIKKGLHALTQAQPELNQANREWQIQIEEEVVTISAFQVCMFETGAQVTSRFHALPGSAQKNFRGFPAIMGDYLRWLEPDASLGAHASFLEAMRQAAETYLHFRTAKYTEHMARTSNIIQHPYDVAKEQYTTGAPTQDGAKMCLIWQTEWLRLALSTSSIVAYATTGTAPTYDNLKGKDSQQVLTMDNYTRHSNAHTESMHAGKRSRSIDAGSLHIIDLTKGLSPSPHKKKTAKHTSK